MDVGESFRPIYGTVDPDQIRPVDLATSKPAITVIITPPWAFPGTLGRRDGLKGRCLGSFAQSIQNVHNITNSRSKGGVSPSIRRS